jgi:hypothetical protein
MTKADMALSTLALSPQARRWKKALSPADHAPRGVKYVLNPQLGGSLLWGSDGKPH